MEHAKVLWIEDDAFLNELIGAKFGNRLKLKLVTNGNEAFAELARERPDVIVLDLLLPGMDGFAILEKLKEGAQYKEIPVIVLSNLGQQSDIDRAMQLGAAAYLIKANFNLDDILTEIGNVIATHGHA